MYYPLLSLTSVGVSLTVDVLVEKLSVLGSDEKKLRYLGVWLNTPPSERASLPRLLTYFLEMHPFGSWRIVIWALDAIGEHQLAAS